MLGDELMSKLPKETQKAIKSAEKLGKREYVKLKKAEQKHLRETADQFLEAVREKVDSYVLLHDIDGLDRLVTQVEILGGFEVIHALKEKGLSKEITALCDKAGLIGRTEIQIKNKEEGK